MAGGALSNDGGREAGGWQSAAAFPTFEKEPCDERALALQSQVKSYNKTFWSNATLENVGMGICATGVTV